jgi:hypothetical protein
VLYAIHEGNQMSFYLLDSDIIGHFLWEKKEIFLEKKSPKLTSLGYIYAYEDNPINGQCVPCKETEALGANLGATVTKKLCKLSATGGERLRLAQFDWEIK